MHPIRAHWECLILFSGHPLLRIKMLTLDIFGPIRHFGWFHDGHHEKRHKCLYSVISVISVMLTFFGVDHPYLRPSTPYLIQK